ncbi:MAG: type I restriction enzyme HsdR N-terminal domain-containing protein [Flavobacteriales bacterium]|nr:type I restriction enzyme HsdR N-terminal domain-containing protein [Flavobacteriales bacterium]
MIPLNLPKYNFKLKEEENKVFIFDSIRKKFLQLTPEEWVRQNFIQYLITEKKYPKSLFSIEKGIKVSNTTKRVDITIYNTDKQIEVLIECKAPEVKITQKAFDQIARYNLTLNAKYLVVTNGLNHFFAVIDNINNKYIFLKDLPSYQK